MEVLKKLEFFLPESHKFKLAVRRGSTVVKDHIEEAWQEFEAAGGQLTILEIQRLVASEAVLRIATLVERRNEYPENSLLYALCDSEINSLLNIGSHAMRDDDVSRLETAIFLVKIKNDLNSADLSSSKKQRRITACGAAIDLLMNPQK